MSSSFASGQICLFSYFVLKYVEVSCRISKQNVMKKFNGIVTDYMSYIYDQVYSAYNVLKILIYMYYRSWYFQIFQRV